MIFNKFARAKKSPDMNSAGWIICGLGNSGGAYEGTRHNAGFMAVERIAAKSFTKINRMKFKSLVVLCEFAGEKCLLVKPGTFMNKSGEALREAMNFYKIPPEKTLLIFDDITANVGDIRVRRGGSDGGHNGVKNIIYLSGKDNFPRIKIGVGDKPHKDYDLAQWVLSRFRKDETDALDNALDKAAAAAELIVSGQLDKAMNTYNTKSTAS